MTRKYILVIDDEAPMRKLLSINLEACGHSVTAACDGAEALALIDQQSFDLILLDISMPGRNGLQILEAVRPRFHNPIVIVSARQREEDKLAALVSGADDYLVKPFSVAELLARTDVWLGSG